MLRATRCGGCVCAARATSAGVIYQVLGEYIAILSKQSVFLVHRESDPDLISAYRYLRLAAQMYVVAFCERVERRLEICAERGEVRVMDLEPPAVAVDVRLRSIARRFVLAARQRADRPQRGDVARRGSVGRFARTREARSLRRCQRAPLRSRQLRAAARPPGATGRRRRAGRFRRARSARASPSSRRLPSGCRSRRRCRGVRARTPRRAGRCCEGRVRRVSSPSSSAWTVGHVD